MTSIDLSNINNNLPVLVLSSPRTGSTLLANYISKKLNYSCFIEPAQDKKLLHKFLLFAEHNNEYVLKEHALNFLRKYSAETINKKYFTVRIKRRDFISQTLSNYIARHRKKFLYIEGETFVPDTIKLNDEYLLEHFNGLQKYNETLENIKNVDIDLVYEELDITKESIYMPTPEPINIIELKEWANTVLKGRL